MTERRPHWSDDLIDAVRDAVDVEFDDIWKLSDDSILAVIAAVEDWARWEHVPKGTLARLEQAEAAIARVPAGRCVMTDEDYLTAVLNCDDQSGMATDAAWRAVSALRARAERAEAEVQRLHRVIAESLPYIDFAEQFAQAEAAIERVRKLCDDFEHEENLNGDIGRYAVVRVDRVRSALDGAS